MEFSIFVVLCRFGVMMLVSGMRIEMRLLMVLFVSRGFLDVVIIIGLSIIGLV